MCNICKDKMLKATKCADWIEAEYEEIGSVKEGIVKCICGRRIIDNFKVRHNPTGHTFVLGSSCILQIFEDKAIRERIKYMNCDVCNCRINRARYEDHLKTKRHETKLRRKQQFEREQRLYNKCICCQRYNIQKHFSYTKCYSCYNKHKKEEEVKIAQQIENNRIRQRRKEEEAKIFQQMEREEQKPIVEYTGPRYVVMHKKFWCNQCGIARKNELNMGNKICSICIG